MTSLTRPRILLTGFEPYIAGVDVNPSWEIIRPLDGRTVHGLFVRAARLPVAYGAAALALEAAIRDARPDAVLSFGMCRDAHVRVERRFRFASREGESLEPGETPERATLLPVDAALAALRAAGYEAEPSEDAGLYVCEHTGFVLMGLARRMGLPLAGFIHVPHVEKMPVERQRAIPLALIEALAPGVVRTSRAANPPDT